MNRHPSSHRIASSFARRARGLAFAGTLFLVGTFWTFFLITACSSSSPGLNADGSSGVDSDPALNDGGGGGADAFVGPIGGDRPVSVFVPSSYQDGTPMPLVLLLHGYTATGDLQEWLLNFTPLAEDRGFLYAYPEGLIDQAGLHYWNATDACCDHWDVGVDDSSYLRQVIDDIKAVYSVDPRRVYLIGHSNGAFMSHRMACDHADSIAAIASLAGAQWSDVARCQPSEPVSVLQIHGTADLTILYNGGELFGTPYPSAEQTVADWRVLGGCSAVTSMGLDMNLDALILGDETSVLRYDVGCDPGGHAELWSIGLGGHVPVFTDQFAPAVIDFLYAHPKP